MYLKFFLFGLVFFDGYHSEFDLIDISCLLNVSTRNRRTGPTFPTVQDSLVETAKVFSVMYDVSRLYPYDPTVSTCVCFPLHMLHDNDTV